MGGGGEGGERAHAHFQGNIERIRLVTYTDHNTIMESPFSIQLIFFVVA